MSAALSFLAPMAYVAFFTTVVLMAIGAIANDNPLHFLVQAIDSFHEIGHRRRMRRIEEDEARQRLVTERAKP